MLVGGSAVAEAVLSGVRDVLPSERETIGLHEPCISGREWDYVKDCLDSGWVSSVGSYVDRFEAMVAETCGVERAVAIVNGTAALHLCLVLVGVGADDEVLLPALTFVATANAVRYCHALPHLCDCDEVTLGIDASKLAEHLDSIAVQEDGIARNRKTGRRIAALVPMHAFGHPADMDALNAVARDWGISVIEDAAESLGSTYRGKPAGSLGAVSAVSFNGNKIVTTGGGGAVLTNDPKIADRAKHLSTTAKVPHAWKFEHDEVGYNYRLPNINAAIGCAQLEQLPRFLVAKRNLASAYTDAFSRVNGVRIFAETDDVKSNYWLNVLLLDEADRRLRDEILDLTNANGIMTRPLWAPMHQLPMYAETPRMDLRETEALADRVICLPSSAFLAREW